MLMRFVSVATVAILVSTIGPALAAGAGTSSKSRRLLIGPPPAYLLAIRKGAATDADMLSAFSSAKAAVTRSYPAERIHRIQVQAKNLDTAQTALENSGLFDAVERITKRPPDSGETNDPLVFAEDAVGGTSARRRLSRLAVPRLP